MTVSPTLLAIETAGSACSVAVARDGIVIAAERRQLRHGHAEVLLPMVDRVMAEASLLPGQIEIVAAATGPGGFTGIRVGLAAAHGIAFASKAQPVGVSSFAAVAASLPGVQDGRVLLVALDSRRAELCVQLFAAGSYDPLTPPQAILPEGLAAYISGIMGNAPLLVAGDAAKPAAEALQGHHSDIAVAPNSTPDACGVAAAALHRLRSDILPEPLRPLYLRSPDVTLPSRREIPTGAA